MALIFGAPVIEPPGNAAASRSKASSPAVQAARHGRDQVLDRGRPLEPAQPWDADAPRATDAAEVVAEHVDDHHVLGSVLGAREQLARQCPVLVPGRGLVAGCP